MKFYSWTYQRRTVWLKLILFVHKGIGFVIFFGKKDYLTKLRVETVIEISTVVKNNLNDYIITFYRPQYYSVHSFRKEIQQSLGNIDLRKNLILDGNFNVPFDTSARAFCTVLEAYDFTLTLHDIKGQGTAWTISLHFFIHSSVSMKDLKLSNHRFQKIQFIISVLKIQTIINEEISRTIVQKELQDY